MNKTINTADICELAHAYTKLECNRLDIEVDRQDVDWLDNKNDDIETSYSEEAQPIFDKYYDLITNTLNI